MLHFPPEADNGMIYRNVMLECVEDAAIVDAGICERQFLFQSVK